MIGKLKGILDAIRDDSVLVDVNGVCYEVLVSAHTLRQLPGEGEAVQLVIITHVREDHIHLYGFLTEAERNAFNVLLKVNGVGTKMALAIQGVIQPEQMAHAIAVQDKAVFTQVSGVGPKLATRLINELKDVFGGDALFVVPDVASPQALTTLRQEVGAISDAISALTNLGYGRDMAYQVVHKVVSEKGELSVSELIKEGLKELA